MHSRCHYDDGETVIYRRTGSVNATTQRVPQQQPTASLSPELEQVADTVTQRIVPELKDQIAKAIEAIQRTPTLCSTPDTDLSAAHPSSTPGLLKYIYNVKLGAGRCADMGWLTYDQQFRLKRTRNPSMNWGCVDMELWILYISQDVTPTQEPQISQMNAEWLVRFQSHKESIEHYLDDFLLAGEARSGECLHLMNNFRTICSDIGVPLAEEKLWETVIYRRTGSVNATTQRVPQQQPTASLSPELEQVADTVTQRIVPELKDQIAKAIEAIQRTPTLCSTPDTDLSAAHPSSTPGLLKYIYNVKLRAGRCADMGWLTYDQQFRLKRARNPSMNWGCVDMELWLLYISQGVTPTQEPQISQMNAGKCFLYNNKGRCGRSACRYLHRCLKCGGAHAALFCNLKTTQNSQNEKRKPYESFRSDFRREKSYKNNVNGFRFKSASSVPGSI
ncbi:unnamed protein product [Mytilus edulis]|uniref:C3H1-type domain-containing protein n=1 Tax=Mytilus edulis TaxID=6550 RepID=A0A8S3QJS1_MYTED|nr:unnamed protein product [Mytilus edulis]